MNVLHYDTETTGLPVNGQPSDHPDQPRIVSISAILDDETGRTRSVFSTIIKPEGWTIDESKQTDSGRPTAFSIHGITNDVANRFGIPIAEAIKRFHQLIQPGTVISAFNHHFDFKLVKISCAQIDAMGGNGAGEALRTYFEEHVSHICTMREAAANLIGKQRISMKNAYFEMFKEEIQKGLHGSLDDAYSTRRIFHELKRRGHAMEPVALTRPVYDTPPPPQ